MVQPQLGCSYQCRMLVSQIIFHFLARFHKVFPCSYIVNFQDRLLWRASPFTSNASLSSWMDTFNLYPNFDWCYSVEYKMLYFMFQHFLSLQWKSTVQKNIGLFLFYGQQNCKETFFLFCFFFTSPLRLLCSSKNIGSYVVSYSVFQLMLLYQKTCFLGREKGPLKTRGFPYHHHGRDCTTQIWSPHGAYMSVLATFRRFLSDCSMVYIFVKGVVIFRNGSSWWHLLWLCLELLSLLSVLLFSQRLSAPKSPVKQSKNDCFNPGWVYIHEGSVNIKTPWSFNTNQTFIFHILTVDHVLSCWFNDIVIQLFKKKL